MQKWNFTMLDQIFTKKEDYNQLIKLFKKFQNDLKSTYRVCGFDHSDCGEYMFYENDMIESLQELYQEQPDSDITTFIEMLNKILEVMKVENIARVYASF